jgi:hypothetical protein
MTNTELNFFGYRVIDLRTMHPAEAVTASFRYKGYEVSMSTYKPGGDKVAVFAITGAHVHVGDYPSVEAAIHAIDEMQSWGMPAAWSSQHQQAQGGRDGRGRFQRS